MTNLLCSVVVLLSTNVTEHWPQKQIGTTHNQYYDKWLSNKAGQNPYTLEYVAPDLPVFADDTNADAMAVETTITGKRTIEASIEGQALSGVLSNWTVAHWQVDMARVRTNDWFKIGYTFDPPFGFVAQRFEQRDNGNGTASMWALLATNWWVPVKTNSLP